MTGRRTRRVLGALAIGSAAGAAMWRKPETRARARKAVRRVQRETHLLEGRTDGLLYRLGMGGPDPAVSDDIVAERVRAELGPVVRGRDLPHVHVLVERHVAVLHGDVGSDEDRVAVEEATRQVSGVAGVESHLHVGLLPSDTRPSQGRQPSHDLTRLLDAARRHGGGEATALVAVRAVLGTLAAMLPSGARSRLAAHLPADVRELLEPPRQLGTLRHVETVEQLVAVVAATGLVTKAHAPRVLEAVLSELRQLVPEEATEVALVLPPDVRALWDAPGAEVLA